jgi:hypothetical protein
MKALQRLVLFVVGFMAIASSARAESVLLGTDPSTAFGSTPLCASFSGCQIDVQSFTLYSQVTITDIQVVMSHFDTPTRGSDGHFDVALVDKPFGASFAGNVGSGDFPYGPDTGELPSYLIYELFDFSGLDITLGPGTYYFEFTGGAVGPARSTSTTSTAGSFGQSLYCDPTLPAGCNDLSRWQALPSFDDSEPLAITINGNVVTPEPSSWLLLATGVVGGTGMFRHRFKRRQD